MMKQTLSRLSFQGLLLIGILLGSIQAQGGVEDDMRNCQSDDALCVGFVLLNYIKSYVQTGGSTVQLFSTRGCADLGSTASAYIDNRDHNAYNASVQSCQVAAQTIQAKGQQLQSGRYRGQCFELSPASGLESIKNACLSFLTR